MQWSAYSAKCEAVMEMSLRRGSALDAVSSLYLVNNTQTLSSQTSCRRVAATICFRPLQYLLIYSPGGTCTCSGMLAIKDISNKLTFDLLTLKVVSESPVMWATSLPILVFLGLSVLELRPMYATDVRQTDADKSIA